MSIYYQDDFVTLYYGDCLTEHREWLAADVLVTDPPYGLAIEQFNMSNKTETRRKKRTGNVVANDHSPAARDAVLARWEDRPAIVFGSWRVARPLKARHRLIWHKVNAFPGMSNAPWYASDEEIYILGTGFIGKPAQTVYPTSEYRHGASGEAAKVGHPTPKPVGLMERLIEKCPPGIIADPFAGSGATLVAAKNLRRKAIGVELEERYCEIIAKRCAQEVFDFGLSA